MALRIGGVCAVLLLCLGSAWANPSPDSGSVELASPSPSAAAHAPNLVATAFGFLGIRYRRGGTAAETGFDCSGLVRAVYRNVGHLLPRRAEEQAAATLKIDRKDLEPGDLVFFKTLRHSKFSHVGIYVGEGSFIHSPKPGAKVRVESMDKSYWLRRFSGARRVHIDASNEWPAAATAPSDMGLLAPSS